MGQNCWPTLRSVIRHCRAMYPALVSCQSHGSNLRQPRPYNTRQPWQLPSNRMTLILWKRVLERMPCCGQVEVAKQKRRSLGRLVWSNTSPLDVQRWCWAIEMVRVTTRPQRLS